MSLKIIRPAWETVADAAVLLTASNVAENDYLAWNAGTAYAVKGRCIKDHYIYEAQQANTNKDPADPANTSSSTPIWMKVSATNKFAMFDSVADTQTSNATSIDVTFAPGRADSLHIGGIDGASITVTQKDAGVTIYQYTESLALENVFDWKQYFFEPIIRNTDVTLHNLPVYGSSTIQIVINQPGGTAKCGTVVAGLYRDLGVLQWRPRIRLVDYSRVETDDFGNTVVVRRRNARMMSCELFVENELVDEVRRLMAEYTATVLLWSGSGPFRSTTMLGILRDFEAVLDSPAGSFCNVEILGLT